MALKINCTVLTPDRILYDGKVDFAVVQAYDGERGFLFNHIPLMSELGYGMVRLYTGDQIEYLHVEGGLVEIRNNELIVLAENAMKKAELSADDLKKTLNDITSAEKPADFRGRFLLQVEIDKIKSRLKVASVQK
jgi:F-type H+-transporting ATPase subunit epsilon